MILKIGDRVYCSGCNRSIVIDSILEESVIEQCKGEIKYHPISELETMG